MRRLIISTVIALAFAPAGAEAHPSPAGCSANNLKLDFLRDRVQVRRGQTVSYTVAGSNQGAGGCDVTGNTVTFAPPGMDGLPSATTTTLVQDLGLLIGTPSTVFGFQQWTAAADPGVTTALAEVSITGLLHDSAVDHAVTVTKQLGVVLIDPKLGLTVTPSPDAGTAPLSVTYRYTLTNLSSPPSSLKSPAVTHPWCTPVVYASGDADLDGEIDPTETWQETCTRLFTAPAEYSGTATATATSAADELAVNATAPSTTVKVTAPVPSAHLTLTKVATPGTGLAPLSVTYTYTVVNDGVATPIANLIVTDAGCSPVVTAAANAPLAVGATRTFTCTSLLPAGIYTSSAIASGTNTLDNTPVSSAASSTEVTSLLPADPEPTATATATPQPSEPAPTPTAVPTPTATPTPTPAPSARVKFSYSGRFTPARACRGTATVALKTGTKTVASKRVKLDGKCRFKVSFDVARRSLGSATKVTLTAKAAGKRTATSRLTVPKR